MRTCIIYSFPKYYSVYQIKKKEMRRGCGTDVEKRVEYGVLLRKPERKRHNLIDIGIDGKIILNGS
jgi:hypothetical protein